MHYAIENVLWIKTPACYCSVYNDEERVTALQQWMQRSALQLLHRSAGGSLQYSHTSCIRNQLPPATWKQKLDTDRGNVDVFDQILASSVCMVTETWESVESWECMHAAVQRLAAEEL